MILSHWSPKTGTRASSGKRRMLIFDAPAHAESLFKDVDREVTAVRDDTAREGLVASPRVRDPVPVERERHAQR